MSRITLAILIGLFGCGSAINSAAQTRKIDSPEVLKQLLALPAATPRTASPQTPEQTDVRPMTFYDAQNIPPDDAPLEDVLAYWMRWSNSGREPPAAHKQKLLEICISEPELLTVFIGLLPDADSTVTRIKDIYDRSQSNKKLDPAWHEKVRKWLLFNSTYFLDELIAMAHKAKENPRDGDVDKEGALASLARLSWTNAEPILRGLMTSGQQRSNALALSLYYEHALAEKDLGNEERYRRELQAIASDKNQPGYARNVAIESVSLSEWSGRDDWYLSLFQDETLLNPSEGSYGLSPLSSLFQTDLKKWVPIMTRLVESRDINVRSAAASCLVTCFDNSEVGKKALTALLPWLTNPAWANDVGNQRMRVIQALETVDIPESVPGLIWAVENDSEDPAYSRAFAAQALSHYADPRAVPALKKALEKEKDEGQRQRIIKGLIGCHGLSEKEQLEALEAYATKMASVNTRMDVYRYRGAEEEPLTITLTIGKYLGQSRETPSESLINLVLARIEELKSDNAPLANALIEITHTWQGQQVELDIIRRISNGSADSNTISEAIQRRDKLQQGLRMELQGLASVAGAAQGVGAVLLNDATLAQGILNSEDRPAQIGLLACSRVTQMPLPVEMIAPLLHSKDSLLTQAAETYLLAEDSREARDLLWQRHPNEAFVTGWRDGQTYGYAFEEIVKGEDALRAELSEENGPTEIYALLCSYNSQRSVLRIYPDKAVYTLHEDDARYRERTIPQAEVTALKDFLTVGNYLDQGPIIEYCHHGCPSNELLVVSKEKGRRLFNLGGYGEWQQLQEQFALLGAGEGAKVHYKLAEEIKGLEVLYAGELLVNDVIQQGGELRVFVERSETKEEKEERDATYEVDDEDDEELEAQLSRRRLELTNARHSWRVFANDKLGDVTSAPDFYSTIDGTRFITGDEHDVDWEAGYEATTKVGPDSIIVTRNDDGIWRQFAGSKSVRIGTEDGSYSNAVVTRDGKWVIVAKTVEAEEESHIVRINLQTGREYRVNLPRGGELTAIAFLPPLGKVLVRRSKEESATPGDKPKGPDKSEHFLLDPATGATRQVSGDFTPLADGGDRFLQAAEKPDEFWVAVNDEKKNHTQIGRYSLKDFSFKPVMTVPKLLFNSFSMWVDAEQKKVYVVYKGQLLRLPLQTTETPAPSVTKK